MAEKLVRDWCDSTGPCPLNRRVQQVIMGFIEWATGVLQSTHTNKKLSEFTDWSNVLQNTKRKAETASMKKESRVIVGH